MRTLLTALVVASLTAPASAMTLSSPDFAPGGSLPQAAYHDRCGGQDISPALKWSAPPRGTRSLVLTVIDQDPKPHKWSHWIMVDLPASARGVPAHSIDATAPGKGVVSGMGKDIYQGPCPPHGTGMHHYVFTIWAMPAAHTGIEPKAPADEVEAMLKSTALTSASVTGLATQDR